jgi:hypothetical protein
LTPDVRELSPLPSPQYGKLKQYCLLRKAKSNKRGQRFRQPGKIGNLPEQICLFAFRFGCFSLFSDYSGARFLGFLSCCRGVLCARLRGLGGFRRIDSPLGCTRFRAAPPPGSMLQLQHELSAVLSASPLRPISRAPCQICRKLCNSGLVPFTFSINGKCETLAIYLIRNSKKQKG